MQTPFSRAVPVSAVAPRLEQNPAGGNPAQGVMCEPDSREPWFISSAHDQKRLDETLTKFEEAVDLTLDELSRGRHDENKLMPGISG